jgi:hypothetical protein
MRWLSAQKSIIRQLRASLQRAELTAMNTEELRELDN